MIKHKERAVYKIVTTAWGNTSLRKGTRNLHTTAESCITGHRLIDWAKEHEPDAVDFLATHYNLREYADIK